MKLTVAQLNPVVGNIDGNLRRLLGLLSAIPEDVSLLVLPELYLTGYPPRDLLFRQGFMDSVERAVDILVEASRRHPQFGIILGAPRRHGTGRGIGLHNAALLVADGELRFEQAKALLPDYDVFDESRYFDVADGHRAMEFRGMRLGVSICEDAWQRADIWTQPLYCNDPIESLVQDGATVLINIAASPFHRRKQSMRCNLALDHVRRHRLPMVMVNQVGANDELIFDGGSFALSGQGKVIARLPDFEEAVQTIDLGVARAAVPCREPEEMTSIRAALQMGVRDYFCKVGARDALIGLSGGIDSAVTACIAVDALGPENVHTITMPGPYSSPGSISDSRELAARLGVDFEVLPITDIFRIFRETLGPLFASSAEGLTEENLQSRIRGTLLMAAANKFDRLVLATSNKSELSMGYTTLYGDMIGALAVIADLFKTTVYQLARSWNAEQEIIPRTILEKPPSAELRPDQKDTDSLPPYDILDTILQMYIEENHSIDEIIAAGPDRKTVEWVTNTVHRSEYKRRQAVPVLRVTSKSFGVGRRVPVAARYRVPTPPGRPTKGGD